MADGLDLGSNDGEKKPNYLLYGGVLIILVGGLFLLNRYKSSSASATAGSAAGTTVGGTTVGSSPPVQDTTTEYIYNVSNVGNTTTTTAPASTGSAGGSSSGSVPVSTGGSTSSSSAGSSNNAGSTSASTGNPGSPAPVSTPPVDTTGGSAVSAINYYTDTGVGVLNANASSAAKVDQLASNAPTSITGLSAGVVGADKAQAAKGNITGVTSSNVVVLNKSSKLSQIVGILRSNQGVSIPGVSAAEVAALQQQARSGTLTPAEYQKAIGG